MTVGYGDLSIVKDSSRAFSIFYILFSVILVAAAIGNFGAIQAEIKAERDRYLVDCFSSELFTLLYLISPL